MAELSIPRYYWDACVFLSAINNGPAERMPIINALLYELVDHTDENTYHSIAIFSSLGSALAVAEADSPARLVMGDVDDEIVFYVFRRRLDQPPDGISGRESHDIAATVTWVRAYDEDKDEVFFKKTTEVC